MRPGDGLGPSGIQAQVCCCWTCLTQKKPLLTSLWQVGPCTRLLNVPHTPQVIGRGVEQLNATAFWTGFLAQAERTQSPGLHKNGRGRSMVVTIAISSRITISISSWPQSYSHVDDHHRRINQEDRRVRTCLKMIRYKDAIYYDALHYSILQYTLRYS